VLRIHWCSSHHSVVAVGPLAAAPFGLPATVFWSYVCASLLLIIRLIKILLQSARL